MRHKNEFYGIATYRIEQDENHNGVIQWVVSNPTLTLGHTREIEDGDYLEIVDNNGQIKLSKIIYRDTDSYYNHGHRRQFYNGAGIAWAPMGIAMDYWTGVFNAGYRAKLIKAEDVEEAEDANI